ncbi:MAG: hypothetical protein ACI4DV_02385 [Lachnospiraceae bacterium]
MSSKTKIVVFHMKELIYTGIFILLGILLILLLVFMFTPEEKKETLSGSAAANLYVPGTYTSSIVLGDRTVDLQVVVESDYISSISFADPDDSFLTMYPLMESSLQNLSEQICENQSLENISYEEENYYTVSLLLDAISNALNQAKSK